MVSLVIQNSTFSKSQDRMKAIVYLLKRISIVVVANCVVIIRHVSMACIDACPEDPIDWACIV